MPKKYTLVEVIEQEITEPMDFTSLEDAQTSMAVKFAKANHMPFHSAAEARIRLLNGEGNDEETSCFMPTQARCESNGQNYDWKIFESKTDDGMRVETPSGVICVKELQETDRPGVEILLERNLNPDKPVTLSVISYDDGTHLDIGHVAETKHECLNIDENGMKEYAAPGITTKTWVHSAAEKLTVYYTGQ